MKKYVCILGNFLEVKIHEIECERETDYFVWINGSRRAKVSEWDNYFDTWEDAYSSLLKAAERKVDAASVSLDISNKVLDNIKKLSR